jgi:AraC-like DNA-binding protein
MPFSTLVLRHMLGEVERLNINGRGLLTGVVDVPRFQREDFWLEDAQVIEVVGRALRASPVAALGLQLGERGSFAAMGAIGLHIAVVPTFRQALEAMTRSFALVRESSGICLVESDTCLTIQLGEVQVPLSVQRFLTEILLRSLCAMVAQFGGAGAKPRRLLFNYPAPPYVADYHRAFDCELRFNQPYTALVVDRDMTNRVQLLAQPDLAEQLRVIADRQFASWARPNSIADQVRAQLRGALGPTLPSMVHVAHRLGVSERSLRRQLARENVDFRSLVEDELRAVANQMLLQKGIAMKQVAHDLGYRSVSAFHRAFKRWTGASPSAYAAQAVQPGGSSNARTPDDRFILFGDAPGR